MLKGKGICKYSTPSWRSDERKSEKIAVICDQMTWLGLNGQVELEYLSRSDWLKKLEDSKPYMFFCESAWLGIDNSWANCIHHNRRLLIDNRRPLKDILQYCRDAAIPTVFWDKENPAFWDDPVNNFCDTALSFDYIFTTADECVTLYNQMGHTKVYPLMFGYSPELFYPIELETGNNRAAFFGGWYNDQPSRCKDMSEVFDFILQEGMELVIYDRHYATDNENNIFPEKYKIYTKPAVRYEQIREEMKTARFAVNVNTITESETMFARRVFEMMACGRIVISNYSKGLYKMFGDNIWFSGERFPLEREQEILEANRRYVEENHTWAVRLEQIKKAVCLR